jgi:hypothetical protein
MDVLQITRKCAYYMNMTCKEFELGNQAEHFDGENPNDWAVVNESEIRCLKNGKFVADIFIEGETIEIIIPDNFMIIRAEHLGEYDPRLHGIETKISRDFKGDKDPDLTVQWTQPEQPVLLTGPRQFMPQHTMSRKPVIKRAYHR